MFGYGGMAQSVEHIVHIDGVVGSSPTVTTGIPKPTWPGDLSFLMMKQLNGTAFE